jgi:hypothetical protein
MSKRRKAQGKASPRQRPMLCSANQAVCEVCGSQAGCFEVHLGGEKHVFDSFDCAMRGLMPKCSLCGGMILGHELQVGNESYCSYACASLSPVVEVEVRSGWIGQGNL